MCSIYSHPFVAAQAPKRKQHVAPTLNCKQPRNDLACETTAHAAATAAVYTRAIAEPFARMI